MYIYIYIASWVCVHVYRHSVRMLSRDTTIAGGATTSASAIKENKPWCGLFSFLPLLCGEGMWMFLTTLKLASTTTG